MEGKSLLDLVSEFSRFDRELVESGGVITPEMEAQLSLTGDDMQRKVDGYKLYMDHLESRSNYFKDIANQATNAARLFSNHRERLKENIKYAAACLGMNELCGNDWRFLVSNGKPKVAIDEAALPANYWTEETVVVKKVDSEAVLADVKLGVSITGITVTESKSVRAYVNHAGRAKPVVGKEE